MGKASKKYTVSAIATEADGEHIVLPLYWRHVLSLGPYIIKSAIITPSSLWARAALLPIAAAYLTREASEPWVPYVAAACTFAAVPFIVAAFVYLQLVVILKKAMKVDLGPRLAPYYSDAGWGAGSRFFVARRAEGPDGEGGSTGGGGPAGGSGQALCCVGVRNRKHGSAELMYMAVRPGIPDADAALDALLTTALTHCRKAGLHDVYLKLNCAEVALLDACRRAGLGNVQAVPINAWFRAFRLSVDTRRLKLD